MLHTYVARPVHTLQTTKGLNDVPLHSKTETRANTGTHTPSYFVNFQTNWNSLRRVHLLSIVSRVSQPRLFPLRKWNQFVCNKWNCEKQCKILCFICHKPQQFHFNSEFYPENEINYKIEKRRKSIYVFHFECKVAVPRNWREKWSKIICVATPLETLSFVTKRCDMVSSSLWSHTHTHSTNNVCWLLWAQVIRVVYRLFRADKLSKPKTIATACTPWHN